MAMYSVKQLSELAGVTIRTLHHYDEIGLLNPHHRAESGYRYYGKKELLRLQQILFYRELEFPLKEIKAILDEEDFDLIQSLAFQQKELQKKVDRFQQLLKTINNTITNLKNQEIMITDKELYEGFPKEKIETYRKEVKTRWSENKLLETEARLKNLSKKDWTDLKTKQEEVNQLLASLVGEDIESPLVQKAIAKHFELLNQFHPTSIAGYKELGKMYVYDDRFKANYEKYQTGLAKFLRDAIAVFCNA